MSEAYEYILKAINKIHRFFYYLYVKKNQSNQKKLFRISIHKGHSLFPYEISVCYENKTIIHQLTYSLAHKEHFIEL